MHKYKTHVKTKKGQQTEIEPEKIIRDLLLHIFSSTNKKNILIAVGVLGRNTTAAQKCLSTKS